MPSLKSNVRAVLASAFFIYITLYLGPESKTSAGSAQNPDAQEARIHRIEATVVDMSMAYERVRMAEARTSLRT